MKASVVCRAVVVAMMLAGCAEKGPLAPDSRSSEFKATLAGPPPLARVYLLPTHSRGLFEDLDGRATFSIFPENSERGTRLGTTSKSSFLAFDIAPGNYDIAATADPLARVTKPFTFEAGKTYVLRPSFFRSAKELQGAGNVPPGMGFDEIPTTDARAAIATLDMASLTPEGKSFVDRTSVGDTKPTPAAARTAPAVAAPPVPAAVAAEPPAASLPAAPAHPSVDERFSEVQRKLKELKQLRQDGLITEQDYDEKRKAVLAAY
jgi:hypothetical protein